MNKYIKSPIFYMGNKYRLLPQLIPLFPTNINTFYDLFGGWSEKDDLRLFEILEKLDKCGIKWGLSNVFKNKDYTNEHLIKWCEDHNWNVIHIDYSYYCLGRGNANSDEVYICNYNTFEDLD